MNIVILELIDFKFNFYNNLKVSEKKYHFHTLDYSLHCYFRWIFSHWHETFFLSGQECINDLFCISGILIVCHNTVQSSSLFSIPNNSPNHSNRMRYSLFSLRFFSFNILKFDFRCSNSYIHHINVNFCVFQSAL